MEKVYFSYRDKNRQIQQSSIDVKDVPALIGFLMEKKEAYEHFIEEMQHIKDASMLPEENKLWLTL